MPRSGAGVYKRTHLPPPLECRPSDRQPIVGSHRAVHNEFVDLSNYLTCAAKMSTVPLHKTPSVHPPGMSLATQKVTFRPVQVFLAMTQVPSSAYWLLRQSCPSCTETVSGDGNVAQSTGREPVAPSSACVSFATVEMARQRRPTPRLQMPVRPTPRCQEELWKSPASVGCFNFHGPEKTP